MKRLILTILIMTLMSTPVYAVDAERWEKAQEALFNESLPLAEGGDAKAQYFLGFLYNNGDGVVKNKQKAFKWFMRSAQQGYAKAQFYVSGYYETGTVVSQDTEEAIKWLKSSAKGGFFKAQLFLAKSYANGRGVEKNDKEGFKWAMLAAEQGNADAQFMVGAFYYFGRGTIKDIVQTHKWYNISGANGNKKASEARDIIEKKMSPSQIFEAQRLAREWHPSNLKPPSSEPSTSQKDHAVQPLGTGFFVSLDGHIITNYHVVKSCIKIQGRGYGPLQLIAQDQVNDLSLLKADLPPKEVSVFRESSIKLGNTVLAAGFPLQNTLAESMNITEGMVSSMAGLKNDSRFIQITTPVQKGNSGGPLLDTSGMIAGVVTSKFNIWKEVARSGDMPQNINFAIHASIVKRFLEVNNINYLSSQSQGNRENSALAEFAKKITLAIQCGQ